MKRAIVFLCGAMSLLFPTVTRAQFDLSKIGQAVEGVFNKTDLSVEDLAGQWSTTGAAVSFKSDNFLKKAGGQAASAAVESKIDPYMKKLGLIGATCVFQKNGSFEIKMKKMSIIGTATRTGKGTFNFKMKVGKISLGNITTYVEKTSSAMKIMFDASKLRTILNAVSKTANIKAISTATSVLNAYDGLCVGFNMKKTGNVAGQNDSGLGSLLDKLKSNKK